MEYFKNNFEMSQKTISYQLKMLWKLINITDPCFASYLLQKESDNCYFAFRWIICQFKREFMKAKTDDYHDCLIVWETVWTATALEKIKSTKSSCNGSKDSSQSPKTSIVPSKDEPQLKEDSMVNISLNDDDDNVNNGTTTNGSNQVPKTEEEDGSKQDIDDSCHFKDQVSKTCIKLNDTEMFTLCLCLSIIRRERDLIFANDFDACEILKHFNTLNLNDDLNNILLHALNIWYWIKNDGGEEQLHHLEEEINVNNGNSTETEKGIEAAEDFDLLNDDFMMISTMNV